MDYAKFNVGDVVRIVDSTFGKDGMPQWMGLECEVMPPHGVYTTWLKPLTPRPDAGTYTKDFDCFHWGVEYLERVKAVDTLDNLRDALDKARREGYDVDCTVSKVETVTKTFTL